MSKRTLFPQNYMYNIKRPKCYQVLYPTYNITIQRDKPDIITGTMPRGPNFAHFMLSYYIDIKFHKGSYLYLVSWIQFKCWVCRYLCTLVNIKFSFKWKKFKTSTWNLIQLCWSTIFCQASGNIRIPFHKKCLNLLAKSALSFGWTVSSLSKSCSIKNSEFQLISELV